MNSDKIAELRARCDEAKNGTALSHFPIRHDICSALLDAMTAFPLLWEVYHSACHLMRDGEDTAGRRRWVADALAAFEASFPNQAHGVRFQTPTAARDTALTAASNEARLQREVEALRASHKAEVDNLLDTIRDLLLGIARTALTPPAASDEDAS